MIRSFVNSLPFPIKQGAKYIYGAIPPRFRYGKVFWDTYNFLQESQWWSREQLEEYQMRQLEKLLNHAYENVPYYRRVFDERGLKPKDIQDFDDFKKIPYLTKEILEKHKDDFICKIYKKNQFEPAHTGGTTGSPLHFWYKRGITTLIEKAFFWRMWNWFNYHWGDRCLVITGAYEIRDRIQYNPSDKCLYFYNPVFDLTKIKEYLKIIEEFDPKIIRGYPSLIYLIAHFINQYQLKIKCPSLQVIFCASEKMFDFQRKEIREIFNCKVVDHYGHNEMLVLMQKCEENQKYHIISEYGITEIIGKNGESIYKEGEIGEIVGTGFNNYAFPMIRYKTDDWAVISNKSCECGRMFPLVKDIIGRSGDFILTPSGKLVSPTIIEFAIRYIKNFKDIQVVQLDTNMIDIQIIPDVSYTLQEGKKFAEEVKLRIGEDINIKISLMDNIERPFNQKRRFIKSDISKEYLGIK